MPVGALLLTAAIMAPEEARPIADAVATSIAACEAWVMKPITWADHIGQFPKRSGLADQGLKASGGTPDFASPPPPVRIALHGWAVTTAGGKVWITTSDVRPFCHIASDVTGSAGATETLVKSADFAARWMPEGAAVMRDGITSTTFRSRSWKSVTLVVSRRAGTETGGTGVQMVASLQMELGK